MRLNTLLTVSSIYMALAGLGLIFFPQAFGRGAIPADASPALVCYLRLWGSPLLGIAILDWMARKALPSKMLHAIITGNTVGFAAIAALDAWGLFNGARPVTGIFVIIHLFFAVSFILMERKSRMAGRSGNNSEQSHEKFST